MILQIVLLLLSLKSTTLHSIGSFILIGLYRNGSDSIQRLLIINLSVTETIISLNIFIATVSEMILSTDEIPKSYRLTKNVTNVSEMILSSDDLHDNKNVHHKFINIPLYTGLAVQYLLIMIYITIDRLLEVYLSISYPLYCSERQTKQLILLIWTTSGGIILTVTLVCVMSDFEYRGNFFVYVLVPWCF